MKSLGIQAPSQAPALPEIRDIAPPFDVFPYTWWQVALAGLAVAIIIGLLVWLVVYLVRRKPALPPPPTPRSIALQALDALRDRVRTAESYEFSIAVSDVLRRYVDAQFGLRSERQTSPEFLASVATLPRFSGDDRNLLEAFLGRCDLIKFARQGADQEASEELLSSARAFVQGERAT